MLVPRRVKHRKQHHPDRSGAAKGGTKIAFGDYGIQSLESAYVTNRQIESARIAMTRHIRRGGKVWINIYPDRPITRSRRRPGWVSGKGSRVVIANVKPGRSCSSCRVFPRTWRARRCVARCTAADEVRFVRREAGEA